MWGLCFSFRDSSERIATRINRQSRTAALTLARRTFASYAPRLRQAATIEFDASAKSPAVIPFDPDASFEVRDAAMSAAEFLRT